MELKFALMADHVAEMKDGKLAIVGEFDKIRAQQYPTKVRNMMLVFRLHATTSEGAAHKIRIALLDEDGKSLMPNTPELPLTFQTQGPGRPLRGQVIVAFNDLPLAKPGTYEFNILVDGHQLASVPVLATLIEKPGK